MASAPPVESSLAQPEADVGSGTRAQLVVGGRFVLAKKIGNGSFGNVYLGKDQETDEKVALKLEHEATAHPQLINEHRAYRRMEGETGIPRILWFGREGEYWCLVMPLLGPSLSDLHTFCRLKFSLKTTLLLADQIFTRIEYVHSKHTLHRDIKPANFIIGNMNDPNSVNVIHIIDFGLSRPFRSLEPPHDHIPFRDEVSVTGTARFVSVNTHQGMEQSRRDDLEAIMYMLMYFAVGQLPWQNMKKRLAKNRREKHRELALLKQDALSSVCSKLPVEFGTALRYIRKLAFDEEPDYNHIRGLFRNLYEKNGYTKVVFDWSNKQLMGFEDGEICEIKGGTESEQKDAALVASTGKKESTLEQVKKVLRRVADEEQKRRRSRILCTWDDKQKSETSPQVVAKKQRVEVPKADLAAEKKEKEKESHTEMEEHEKQEKTEEKKESELANANPEVLKDIKGLYSAFGF